MFVDTFLADKIVKFIEIFQIHFVIISFDKITRGNSNLYNNHACECESVPESKFSDEFSIIT